MASKGKQTDSDAVDINVDRTGEKELLSKTLTSEGSESSSENESKTTDNDLDEVDEEELQQMLNEKESKLQTAKSEFEKQKEEAKKAADKERERKEAKRQAKKEKEEKRRRIRDLMNKIRKVESETEQVEKEKQVHSRNATPIASPVVSPKKTKHNEQKEKDKKEVKTGKETNDILLNTPDFVELVSEALNKGAKLANKCESELISISAEDALKQSLERATTNVNKQLDSNAEITIDAILNLISNLKTDNKHEEENNQSAKACCVTSSKCESIEATHKENCERTPHCCTLKETSDTNDSIVGKEPRKKKKHSKRKHKRKQSETSASSEESNNENDSKQGKTKLKSGKYSNPDKVGIQRTVSYPHEKLDLQFVKVREFDILSFHFFVAGEIELIIQNYKQMSGEERMARLKVLKNICYHREYLHIEDLRQCYDSVMKEVETGRASWTSNLDDKVHQFCQFRANVITREKLEKQVGTGAGKQHVVKKKEPDIFYCNEYNRESGFTFTGNHEGRFNNKPVWKLHICKKCYVETREKRNHSECDVNCPKKAA